MPIMGRDFTFASDIRKEGRSVPKAHDGKKSELCGSIGYLS